MEAGDTDEHYSGLFGVPAPLSRHPDAFWIDGQGLLGGRTSLTGSHDAEGRLQKARRLQLVFAHELGHNLGRPHTPCDDPVADPGQVDAEYPHARGTLGAWGHDFGEAEGPGPGHLFDPEGYRDLMSYCHPQWISDYSFTRMLEFRLAGRRAAGERAGGAGPHPLPRNRAPPVGRRPERSVAARAGLRAPRARAPAVSPRPLPAVRGGRGRAAPLLPELRGGPDRWGEPRVHLRNPLRPGLDRGAGPRDADGARGRGDAGPWARGPGGADRRQRHGPRPEHRPRRGRSSAVGAGDGWHRAQGDPGPSPLADFVQPGPIPARAGTSRSKGLGESKSTTVR